jgi:hypothetical protein
VLLFVGLQPGCEAAVDNERTSDDDEVLEDATLEGTAQLLIAEYPDHSETLYFLETDDGLHVRVKFAFDPGPIQPGELLALAGSFYTDKSLGEPSFTATSVLKHLGADEAALEVSALRAPVVHRTAVILLGATDITRQQALDQVNPKAGSAASYLAENSNGVDTFEGDVFGPYNVDTSNCNQRPNQIADLARQAAAADGRDLSRYNKLAFVLPKGSGCSWGGLGQVGRPGQTRQLLTWYNNWFDCGVVSHELGHNLGMNHSHSTKCANTVYNAGRAGCSDVEYGHVFDVMGNGNCGRAGHFSAPQKQYMGWLEGCEDVTAGGIGVFNLSPIEGSCGIRSLRIPIAGESNYYYVEYRKTDAGAFGGASAQDRVLLSVSNDGMTVRPDLYLLDSTPSSTSGHKDAWLVPGTAYSLPGNVRVKVLEQGELARVEVIMPERNGATCHDGTRPPKDAAGRFGLGCGDGCPSDPNKTDPGFCGCGVRDVDTDADGAYDCVDGCPADPNKGAPGECGCGKSELECTGLAPGLIRKHYRGQWSSLPRFDDLTPTAEAVTSSIDVNDFAGQDEFGVVFTGGLRIDKAGTYEFELASDDGSRLRVGDRDVIVNDGLHGFMAKTGQVTLSAGVHALRVEFFERGGGERLQLRMRQAGGTYATVPAASLVHATDQAPDACPNDPAKTEPGVCGCGVPEGSCGSDEALYEAEARSQASGCNQAANHAGFTGAGFMDYGGNGTWIEWTTIKVPRAGTYLLTFRYANGSGGNRASTILVNGQSAGFVSFPPTGGWPKWSTQTLSVSLRQGANTLRVLASTGSGGPNLDHVVVKAQ